MGECIAYTVGPDYLPRLYLRGLIDRDTGKPVRSAIRKTIREFTGRGFMPWPFRYALRVVINEARIEQASVIQSIEIDKYVALRMQEYQARVHSFAALFNFDVAELRAQLRHREGFGASSFNFNDDDRALARDALELARRLA